MSTAHNINSTEEPTPPSDNSVPCDIEGDPITFDGNPAHAEGVRQEIIDCIMRTGKFKMLVVKHAVPAGYKTAVDSAQAIPFLRGDITDHNTTQSSIRLAKASPPLMHLALARRLRSARPPTQPMAASTHSPPTLLPHSPIHSSLLPT